jgi:hypothetical protein
MTHADFLRLAGYAWDFVWAISPAVFLAALTWRVSR